jgi:hypothetical protein
LGKYFDQLWPMFELLGGGVSHTPYSDVTASKVAGSNLNEIFSMWLKPSLHVKRVKVNALPKVVGFLLVLRFPPQGKLTGWVRHLGQGEVH